MFSAIPQKAYYPHFAVGGKFVWLHRSLVAKSALGGCLSPMRSFVYLGMGSYYIAQG